MDQNQDEFQSFQSCPNCGKRNNLNSMYCWKCGFNFSASEKNDFQNESNHLWRRISSYKLIQNKKLLFLVISLTVILILLPNASDIYYEIKGEREILNKGKYGNIFEKYSLEKIDGTWRMEGMYTSYHSNGQVSIKGTYQSGKKEGIWEEFFESGRIKTKKKYHLSKEIGESFEYYENGQISAQCYYNQNHQMDGRVLTYYENGNLEAQLEFTDGKKNGNFIEYNEAGVAIITGSYKNDKKDSIWIRKNDNSVMIQKKIYKDGLTLSDDYFRDEGTIKRSINYNDRGEVVSDEYFDNNGRNCFVKFIGTYSKKGEDIYTSELVSRTSDAIQIIKDKKYVKKEYSYFANYEMIIENTQNIRGNVEVTEDSLFFFPKESRKYPARSYIPAVESRRWIDNSEKTWSKCKDTSEVKFSIQEFLKLYKK